MTAASDLVESAPRSREVSGTVVVIAMVAVGLVATAVMYVYWDLHTKPFRPLTEAIGRTFKHSLPKVEGGRHKQNPAKLRIAFRVPFPPGVDEPQTRETLQTVFRLIRQHQDLSGFDTVEIHLFQMVPEETVKKKSFEFTPDDVLSDRIGL